MYITDKSKTNPQKFPFFHHSQKFLYKTIYNLKM